MFPFLNKVKSGSLEFSFVTPEQCYIEDHLPQALPMIFGELELDVWITMEFANRLLLQMDAVHIEPLVQLASSRLSFRGSKKNEKPDYSLTQIFVDYPISLLALRPLAGRVYLLNLWTRGKNTSLQLECDVQDKNRFIPALLNAFVEYERLKLKGDGGAITTAVATWLHIVQNQGLSATSHRKIFREMTVKIARTYKNIRLIK